MYVFARNDNIYAIGKYVGHIDSDGDIRLEEGWEKERENIEAALSEQLVLWAAGNVDYSDWYVTVAQLRSLRA